MLVRCRHALDLFAFRLTWSLVSVPCLTSVVCMGVHTDPVDGAQRLGQGRRGACDQRLDGYGRNRPGV
jgi:hypothetical protein